MEGRRISAFLLPITAVWMLCATPALAQQGLEGAWRARVEHGGETDDFYLTFGGVDQPVVAFAIPSVRLFDIVAGRYQVTDDAVQIPGLGWRLSRDGDALTGVLPRALVPHYDIEARFERVTAPPRPAVLVPPATAAPAPLWTASLGAAVWAGLAYDARRQLVYAATIEGRVVALKGRTGEVLWSRTLGSEVRATPTLRGQRLYIATDTGAFALNARTGAELWSARFGEAIAPRLPISNPNSNWDHYSASVVLTRGMAIAAARDGCVYAFDASSGAEQWRECGRALLTGTPAIARARVYVGDFDGNAYALSLRDGAEVWRRREPAAMPRDAVIAGDNVVLGTRAYDLVALNVGGGEPAWRRYFWYSWVDSAPTVAGDALYVGSSDALVIQAFNVNTGQRLWSAPVSGWSWPRVAVAGGNLYAGIVGGAGYLAPRTGALVAMDRHNGALLWSLESAAGGGELTGFGSAPVAAGRRLFAADLGGTVHAFAVN